MPGRRKKIRAGQKYFSWNLFLLLDDFLEIVVFDLYPESETVSAFSCESFEVLTSI